MGGPQKLVNKMAKSLSSGHTITQSLNTGVIVKDNKEYTIGVAIQTSKWTRDPEIAKKQAHGFQEAVKAYTQPFAEGTDRVIQRDTLHEGPTDQRPHYTAVCFDVHGNKLGDSLHVLVADDEKERADEKI